MPCGATRTKNLSAYLVGTLFHGSLTHMIEIKMNKILARSLAGEKHSCVCVCETEGQKRGGNLAATHSVLNYQVLHIFNKP